LENFLRVEPTDLDPSQIAIRQQFKLKLTGLPYNTDQRQLIDFLTHIKAKSCFIPRDQQYHLRPYAFVNLANNDDLISAANQSQKFKGKVLYWMDPSNKHCRICGTPNHELKDCTNRKPANPYKPLYDRFKPEQYRPPRSFQLNNQGPYRSFSHVLQNEQKSSTNNTQSNNQKIDNGNKQMNVPPNTSDAFKLIQEKLDNIENKLTLIEDEIVSLKNGHQTRTKPKGH